MGPAFFVLCSFANRVSRGDHSESVLEFHQTGIHSTSGEHSAGFAFPVLAIPAVTIRPVAHGPQLPHTHCESLKLVCHYMRQPCPVQGQTRTFFVPCGTASVGAAFQRSPSAFSSQNPQVTHTIHGQRCLVKITSVMLRIQNKPRFSVVSSAGGVVCWRHHERFRSHGWFPGARRLGRSGGVLLCRLRHRQADQLPAQAADSIGLTSLHFGCPWGQGHGCRRFFLRKFHFLLRFLECEYCLKFCP